MAIGTTQYPGALDTAVELISVLNAAATTVGTGGIDDNDTTIPVASDADASATGGVARIATYDESGVMTAYELVTYAGKSTNTLTECVRGFDGSTAQAWNEGDEVVFDVIASVHHEALRGAILALEAVPKNGPDYLILNTGGTYEAYARNGTRAASGSNFVTVFNTVKGSDRWIMLGSGDFDMGTEHVTFNTISDLIISGQGIGVTHVFNDTDAAEDSEPWSYTNCQRMVVRDMDVSAGGEARTSSDAIDFDGGDGHLIERVRVLDSRGRGIVFDGKDMGRTCDGNVIRDCVVTGCRGGTTQAGSGILCLGAQHNLIAGCRIFGNTGYGIAFQKASSSAGQPNKKSSGNRAIGNWITENGISGVNIHASDGNVITGNVISNNSDDQSGRDGIEFTFADSITAEGNVIANNRIFDDQGTETQDYGVNLGGADAIGTAIVGNAFAGNVSGAVNDVGTDTVIWANTGVGSLPTTMGLSFVIDGGGSAIGTGVKGWVRVPFQCVVTGWEVFADAAGSIVVDVDRATYSGLPTFSSIAGSEKPTLSDAQKNQDLSLSTWTTTLAEGDWLRFEVESAEAVTMATVSLILRRA